MVVEISFAPGAVTAGTNIDLPAGAPPIDEIIDAVIFEGNAVNEGGTATYTIGPVAVTATKVDENTITLDTNTTAYSLLILKYVPVGVKGNPSEA